MWKTTCLIAVLTLPGIAGCGRPAATLELTDADRRAIRANDSLYVSAWQRDDTAGVLSTLEPNPVLMPGGLRPLRGVDQARAFWWPADGSHTKIEYFQRTIDEIGGAGTVAFVRGTDSLRFLYTPKDGKPQESGMRSETLAVVRRQADGSWKIARMAWATVTH